MTGEAHRVSIVLPAGAFESARMDMASSRMLVVNDGYFEFKDEGTYGGAFRKFHGKELDLNNSYKSGLEVFSSYHLQILKVNHYQPNIESLIRYTYARIFSFK